METPRRGDAALYVDGTFGLLPDLLPTRKGEAVFVADAKYKSPSPADHYQMQVYLEHWRVERGVLISAAAGVDGGVLTPRRTRSGRTVTEVALPMGDLMEAERLLLHEVGRCGGLG